MYNFCDFCGRRVKLVYRCGYRAKHYAPQLIGVTLCEECIEKEGNNVIVRDRSINE